MHVIRKQEFSTKKKLLDIVNCDISDSPKLIHSDKANWKKKKFKCMDA